MKTRVAVERGDKKFFATAVEWPGWSRSGKSREEALDRLVAYAGRYRDSIGKAADKLVEPRSAADLEVIATAHGDLNIDYGVPHSVMAFDREKMGDADCQPRSRSLGQPGRRLRRPQPRPAARPCRVAREAAVGACRRWSTTSTRPIAHT